MAGTLFYPLTARRLLPTIFSPLVVRLQDQIAVGLLLTVFWLYVDIQFHPYASPSDSNDQAPPVAVRAPTKRGLSRGGSASTRNLAIAPGAKAEGTKGWAVRAAPYHKPGTCAALSRLLLAALSCWAGEDASRKALASA